MKYEYLAVLIFCFVFPLHSEETPSLNLALDMYQGAINYLHPSVEWGFSRSFALRAGFTYSPNLYWNSDIVALGGDMELRWYPRQRRTKGGFLSLGGGILFLSSQGQAQDEYTDFSNRIAVPLNIGVGYKVYPLSEKRFFIEPSLSLVAPLLGVEYFSVKDSSDSTVYRYPVDSYPSEMGFQFQLNCGYGFLPRSSR